MRCDVLDSLTKVPGAAWNALAESTGLYSSHEWLRTVEADVMSTSSGRCAYVVVSDAGRAVAALPVYLVEQESNEYYLAESHFLVKGRSITAGIRQGYRNAPLLAGTLTAAERQQAVGMLLDALEEFAEAQNATQAVFLFLTRAGLEDLRADARVTAPILNYAGDAWLEAPGERFEDYLESLSGKTRWQVRRDLKRFEAAGLEVALEDPRELVDVVTGLVDRNNRKYGREMPLAEQRAGLVQQLAELGDRARLFVCRSEGDIVAVALGYVWDGWYYGRTVGFDYDRIPGAHEYFSLVFYQPLRHCYESGLRGLHLGAGSHQTKGIRGARIEPLFSVVLPFDGTPADDLLPPGARHQVREYWEEQMEPIPRAFDRDRWSSALDLCCPIGSAL